MRACLVVLLGAALFACSSSSGAQVDPPAAPAPSSPRRDVYWHDEWPRFSVAELLISAAVTARNVDFGLHFDGPTSATIKFEVPLLDRNTRDLFRANTVHERDAWARLGDVGFRALVLAPYVIDVGVAALAIHRNYDVAAQLALIDFEVLTLAGMTQLLVSRVIGRARPYVQECRTFEECTGGPYRGFLSGHAMATFTAAGLMCVHHEKLPLFGGGAPDTWACVWALSLASLTSFTRLAADEHYVSDVFVGAGLGWIYGNLLPRLLHFHAAKVTKTTDGGRRAVTWLPSLTGTTDSGMLGVMGTF
jgi:membrane-associated phospholipid phosphatase